MLRFCCVGLLFVFGAGCLRVLLRYCVVALGCYCVRVELCSSFVVSIFCGRLLLRWAFVVLGFCCVIFCCVRVLLC